MFKAVRKHMAAALAAVLALCLTGGCAGPARSRNGKDDPDVLTITLGPHNSEQIIEGLANRFPDIRFAIEPTYCCNQSEYLRQTLLSDNASDLFYYTQKASGAEAAEHLLDLSGYDFISNFDRAVLNTYDVDGRIYQIPGPMAIRGMAYNKTLFEEHGWRKPENHRELVALCRQIRAETDDITPIAMSLGGVGYPFTTVTTLSQAGFFGTPAGEAWEKRFLAGEASIAEGWGEGLEMTAELIDAGAFNPEPYIGVWDADACRMEFAEGKAAMFAAWSGQAELLNMMTSSSFEYALMPFYGREDGDMIIGATAGISWGIPRRLAGPGNEKKLENALRVMEWLSTPEGQNLMRSTVIDENGEEVFSAAEMIPLNAEDACRSTSPYFVELWELAERGNKMPMIYSGYESVIVDAGTIIQDAMLAGTSEGMIDRFVSTVDSEYRAHLAGDVVTSLGTVEADLTEEETAQLLADALYETGLGDLALLTHTGRAGKGLYNKRGAAGRVFAGHITNTSFNTVLGENKPVQTLTLTGAQIKELLSAGKRVVNLCDETESVGFPYYWSGIEVSLSGDGRVKSAKLNGAELAGDGVYRVVFCNGDYTEEIGAAGAPVDCETTFGRAWTDYLAAHSPVSAPRVLRGIFSAQESVTDKWTT